MRVRAESVEVSSTARRGLATLRGEEERLASHAEILEAIAEVLESTVDRWQQAGEQAIRDQELRQAELQFEEARERLDAARSAATDDQS